MAVFYPLQHYSLMSRARRWLFLVTWLTWAVQPTCGIFAAIFQLQTRADSVHGSGNGTAVYPECRWESSLANFYTVLVEVQIFSFSLATFGLFIYTFSVGRRMKVRLMREMREIERRGVMSQEDGKFFDNFNAFKKIVWVFSLTVTMDIITPILRFSNQWYPMPRLNGFLHQLRLLGFIFEGWAYGLLNTKLKSAYKKTLCVCVKGDQAAIEPSVRVVGRSSHLTPPQPQDPEVQQRQSQEPPAADAKPTSTIHTLVVNDLESLGS